jgi:AcrR family transcriptional regulator
MPAQKDNSEPRRPGRPRGGKRVTASREQLLDIALSLFSRQGIANTSLNAIAKEAGVTPAMLHYYFNSREQLLDAMIEERFLPLRSKIGTIFAEHRDSPVNALTQMVKVLADLAGRNRSTRWAPLPRHNGPI